MVSISTWTETKGIGIEIPDKVFFSSDPVNYIVKNDFYFTVYKTASNTEAPLSAKRGSGELYPAIYIKGLEKLFSDGMQAMQLDAFCKMFHTNGNTDWSISYGKFRDTEDACVIITTAALSLETDFSVGFQLSDKCAFTNILDVQSPVTLEVYIDDFDFFFGDVSNRIQYNITLERMFAVYVENFGAYLSLDANEPVSAVAKGDSCYISWNIKQNEKASVFLYDEEGDVVANLPPYTAKIDKDKKFTIIAYNDFCSVIRSIHVYRTLWRKDETENIDFPQTDEVGRYKFYRNESGTYYLYVHPNLYSGRDLTAWNIASVNTQAPAGYHFYSSAFSENRVGVCYLSNELFTYCEMNSESGEWKKYEIPRSGLLCAYAFISHGDQTVIALSAKDEIGFYELVNGSLMNPSFLKLPEDISITAMDVYSDGTKDYLGVLSGGQRVYFYDLYDDYKNNIFECSVGTDDNIYLLRSNALYIALSKGILEASDREKFSDTHFFPKYRQGTRPVMGAVDSETLAGIFQTESGTEIWKYKF